MIKRMLKSNVTKYLSLSLLLCTAIYSTTFISSPLAEIKNKEANNIIDTKITDNISDRNNTINTSNSTEVTSENYDSALKDFIKKNNYDYNIDNGLNILDEFMQEYGLDCLVRTSE